jgi:nuclear factor related to kappa-B-binding protein
MKYAAADFGERDEDANLLSSIPPKTDELPSFSMKRKSKKKPGAEIVISEMENSELLVTDTVTADVEPEAKPQKKPFILITPTVHTEFSFSIMHLLSAVRMAMLSPPAEESLEGGKPVEQQNKTQEDNANGVISGDKVAADGEPSAQLNTPSLTVQEIVNRVRSNPGDPCILETQEPLQDLVRGVLKIFSSKTAPLGAKGWKVLAVYERSTRSWSWTGPALQPNSSDLDPIEAVASPEAWGLPHKMLVKLVDSFANWLKCGQDTLKQIGSLPAPPLALMQANLDEKERFRDLRAQKSLNTISPSSEEVRAYFRKEELLRYSIPDRAFSYTAADGKKSIVAPLRRCGGKPTSKARDHFMLKRDRPPHVTILCLVRDAAARLPGSIGTRADVCTLIRDSQYIVEDVSDAQINQVVSGALDRLHYERDPCVQFDGERKLWVYLHREREEEDFEDDGTSSTKKWKRQKKDATDQSDQPTVAVACNGTGEQSGYDLCSDLNVDPPCNEDDKGTVQLLPNDTRLNAEDHVVVNPVSEEGNVCEDNSMAWETLDLNPTRELCQENSTNEDFGDESFGQERPVGLLSATLL